MDQSKKSSESISKSVESVVARTNDGTIQITFTIPFSIIKTAQDDVITDFAKETEIAGFRKGKAPAEKVREKIPQNTLIEKSLNKILPEVLAETINKHKIKPATYPKFELLKAEEGEAWQLRATTCELPEVNLGDYKNIIVQASKAKTIWTPGKDIKEESPSTEASRDKKEQEIIKILLDNIKITIPKVLIDEEVNSRLSLLLERLEKLGLNLDGYLGSLGKTSESLRAEYELQAKNTIAIELILNAISVAENIKIDETKIDEAIKAASADSKLSEKLNTPEQRRFIRNILSRRETLDKLSALI